MVSSANRGDLGHANAVIKDLAHPKVITVDAHKEFKETQGEYQKAIEKLSPEGPLLTLTVGDKGLNLLHQLQEK